MSDRDLEKALASWIPERRWFRAKSRKVHGVRILDSVPLPGPQANTRLLVVCVEHDGGTDDYVVALAGGDHGGLHDALGDAQVAASLLELFESPPLRGESSVVRFEALSPYAERRRDPAAQFEPRPVTTEQTNTSIVFGDSFVLKVLRQLDEGSSPDAEMGEFLTATGYAHAPLLAGTVTLERAGKAATLGVMHAFTPNEGDAWTFTLQELSAFLADGRSMERYAGLAELLGKRVGGMHVALGSRSDVEAFAPIRLDRAARQRLADGATASLDRVRAHVAAEIHGKVGAVLERFVSLPTDPVAMRVHGDLHLGQVLFTGSDFAIIDFEGEPARPLVERKAKRPPQVDVAGMLRSFHYAAMTGLRESGQAERARGWHRVIREAFLRGYHDTLGASQLLPANPDEARVVLDFCLLEKCIYEVNYEADNRPDWIGIPLEGLAEVASGGPA